jgi:hypothetical protein
MITPREIVARAWAITKRERKLRKWGYASSIFETTRSVELILYQTYYLYWYLQGITVGWFSVEMLFFRNFSFWLFVTTTVILIILFVLQLFVPTLASGAIIGLGAKAHRNEEMKGGLVLALYNFFPILEVHAIFILSSFAVVFTIGSILLRYIDGSLQYGAIIMLCLLSVIAIVFHFFASFAEEGIVIRKHGVFRAIGKSFKLILSNLGHVMFLLILLVVISIRIFINAVVILIIPGFIMLLVPVLALFLPTILSYAIAGIVGVILLIVISYFFAYLHIFKQTVWTITYLELSELKEVDVIVEEE